MPLPHCVNLRELFGNRFVVTFEESYYADMGKGVHRGEPALMIIPCTGGRGHFYVDGGEVGVSVDRPRLGEKLVAIGCRLHQAGDDGANLVFPLELFEEVARVMKPRRRRRLKPEQRQKNAQRLKTNRSAAMKRPHGDSTARRGAATTQRSAGAAHHPVKRSAASGRSKPPAKKASG